MEKMLNFFVIASVLTVVCGTQYAYFGDNLVEFDDVSTNSISVPYPYRVPQVVSVPNKPVKYGVSLHTSTAVQKAQVLSPIDLLCSMVTSVYGFMKSSIMFVIKSIPALIFGCFSFFGLCSFTSACKFFNIDSLPYIKKIGSFATPERLKSATDFFMKAMQKYNEL